MTAKQLATCHQVFARLEQDAGIARMEGEKCEVIHALWIPRSWNASKRGRYIRHLCLIQEHRRETAPRYDAVCIVCGEPFQQWSEPTGSCCGECLEQAALEE